IAENVQRAAQGTAEIAGAIEGVTGAAGETGGAASQVQATSATLAQQAETLRAEVGNFLGRVRAA
ncbi:MAG TPA: methyl-accepting chemotaxis protein, partial [Acetobacteraceae bacterium]